MGRRKTHYFGDRCQDGETHHTTFIQQKAGVLPFRRTEIRTYIDYHICIQIAELGCVERKNFI